MPQIVWRKMLEVWETPGIEGYLDNEGGRFNSPLTMGLWERRGGGSRFKVFSLDIH